MDGQGQTNQDPAVIDDDGAYEDLSGGDIDLMGDGLIYPKLVLPDPDSGQKDCVIKEADGTCPAGCCECATFRLGLENWLRTRRMEEEA